MHVPRLSGAGRLLSFGLLAWLATPAAARADVQTFDGAQAPIVRIEMQRADVTVRTWDRNAVTVDGDPNVVTVARRTSHVPETLPPTPISPAQIDGPNGTAALPAESFVVSSLPAGPRDTLVISQVRGAGPAGPVTVTIPNDTALLRAHVVRGSVAVDGYQRGTYVVFVRNGHVALNNVGGDGFAQVLRGPLAVTDSDIQRLRARTALGNMVFERCRSRQIEATSVDGSIVYDGGSFAPGLARFDSYRGNVAIGTAGAAQLTGRVVGGGKVYTLFDKRAQVENGASLANAVVDGGGPVINASSGSGNVYLYDGSLRTRSQLPAEWKPARETLTRRVGDVDAAPGAPEPPRNQNGPGNRRGNGTRKDDDRVRGAARTSLSGTRAAAPRAPATLRRARVAPGAARARATAFRASAARADRSRRAEFSQRR